MDNKKLPISIFEPTSEDTLKSYWNTLVWDSPYKPKPSKAFMLGYNLAKSYLRESIRDNFCLVTHQDALDLERLRREEAIQIECDKRCCSECESYHASSTMVWCSHEEHPQNDYAFDFNMAPRCHWYKLKEKV